MQSQSSLGGERRTQNNVVYLPEELIIEILLRLPVKSLLRFKRVCNSWLSLISDANWVMSIMFLVWRKISFLSHKSPAQASMFFLAPIVSTDVHRFVYWSPVQSSTMSFRFSIFIRGSGYDPSTDYYLVVVLASYSRH